MRILNESTKEKVKMRKGKEILWGFCFLVLVACASFAQSEVRVKYGGPSGQGTVIWYAPSTGVTNMVLSTNGTSFGPILDNLVVAGDITSGGATATGSASTLTNSSNAGACSITTYADIGSDAGDTARLLFGDNGGVAFQTDKASKGTLATKFTIGEAGRLTMVGGATLDNDTSTNVLVFTEDTIDLHGLTITDELDTRTATALLIGKANATGVTIGASDANTTIAGDLVITGLDIDSAAGAMTIGKANATSLALGAADITTTVLGPLVVNTQLWLGTNGYFQITGKNLEFVCPTTAFTNTVVDDITQ